MKKTLFYLFILLFFQTIPNHPIHAQQCGVFSNGDNVFLEINGDINAEFDIKVYWNWVRQSNGTSANNESLIKSVISDVKQQFSDMGIHFVSSCAMTEDNFRVIDDSSLYNGLDGNSCFLDNYCLSDGLNVFFFDGNTNGLSSGRASLPGNRLHVRLDELEESNILMHEIGHCFGLFHTYIGRPWEINTPQGTWECDKQEGITGTTLTLSDCDNQTTFTKFSPFALVDNTNASTTGDYVVDTPADINFRANCDTEVSNCDNDTPCDLDEKDNRFKDPNCQHYDPDYNNYMGSRRFCSNHFTDGQIRRMKGVIANNLGYMMVLQEVTISEDQTIEMDGSFDKITVADGVHLTIKNSTLYFSKGGRIFLSPQAKLTIDNSTLTSCEAQWKGVSCHKRADKVELINNSRIKNAEIGIKLADEPFGSGIPIDPNTPHPILFMSKSIVTLCNIGIQFGYGKTESRITGTSGISKCDIGIKYLNHSGLVIEECGIGNSKEGIYSLDGHITFLDDVEIWGGNYFPMEVGISAEGTLPLAAGLDIGNENSVTKFVFITGVGIIANGLEHPTGANVTNCITGLSNGGDAAAYFAGANDFQFVNNSVFNIDRGAISLATGANPNNVNCNVFDDIELASNISMFANTRTNFLENQYSGNQKINFVLSTSVIPTQGAPSNPARNCFSDPSEADHILNLSFLTLGTAPFTYHYYDDSNESEPCQAPDDPQGYNTQKSNDLGSGHCDGNIGIFNLISSGGPGNAIGIDPQHDDPDFVCLPCIDDEIKEWIDEVVNTGGDDPRTSFDESDSTPSPRLPINEAILHQWINYAIYVALETNNFGYGEQVLTPLITWKWQMRRYGFYVLKGDLVRAEQVLNLLTEDNANQIQFKKVQRINLKRIQKLPISRAEIDGIYDIATGREPALGYARSLYRALTGIRIPLTYPDLGSKNTPRSSMIDEAPHSIYPNPTSGELHISWSTFIQEITILDITGKIMAVEKARGKNATLDMTVLNKGIYILQIQDEMNTLTSKKIIKL